MNEIEEAIEHYETQNEYCEDKEAYQDEYKCNDLAMKALEKQVPEAPMIISETYHCPECGASIQVKQNVGGVDVTADRFCRNCGQALVEVESLEISGLKM